MAELQVGDERFNSTKIQRLCEAADYPLRHRMTARHLRVREDTMDPPFRAALDAPFVGLAINGGASVINGVWAWLLLLCVPPVCDERG
jgi:hypothetical protein